MQAAVAEQTPTIHIYFRRGAKIRTLGLVLYVAFWTIMLILEGTLIRTLQGRIGIALLAVAWLIVVGGQFVGWRVNRAIRLEVTGGGVTLHWCGATLIAPWEGMECIGTVEQRWYWNWEGITLRHVHWTRGRWPFGTQRLPQFIPLLGSSGALWDRELGEDLRRHAPWLVTEGSVVEAHT